MLARISLALAMAPFMPFGPGVSTISAPKARRSTRRSSAHRLRHGEDELVALHRRDKGEGDAGVAAGGFDQNGFAGLDFARLLGVFDHRQADAVFHAGERILAFELGNNGGGQSGGNTVEPHQRGVSNQFSHIRGNTRHTKSPSIRGCARLAVFMGEGDGVCAGEIRRERLCASEAHARHRSRHQVGVSDIDACK